MENQLGAVLLFPDPRSEVDEVWADVRLNLTVLGAFFIAAFAFVTLVIGRALAPIRALSDAMRRIGDGDYAVAVPISGSPELALLCRGCNDMAGRLAEMSARNRQLGEQLVRLQDEERAELARELHDEVGPLLFAVDVDVAEIARIVETDGGGPKQDTVAAKAGAARQAASHARAYVRGILGRLRPGLIGSLGLSAAIRELAAFQQAREPEIDFVLDLADGSFGSAADAVVLAVVREAVVNAVKHASPSRIEISVVDLGGEAAVAVVDDGMGIVHPAGPPIGYGIVGMRERIEAAGGTLAIGPRPTGRGTARLRRHSGHRGGARCRVSALRPTRRRRGRPMKILVVDDHVIVREGVSRLLAAIERVEIVEAETTQDALAVFRREKPDVVVLDINLKGGSGLELLRRFRIEDPDTHVVIFSMYSDVVYATSARRAGAIGYVSKSASSDQLLTAVRRAARGESYVDTEIASELALTAFAPQEPASQLTPRELEILRMLADGQSLSDIADRLGVAYKTVANTCTRIKEKLGVDRTADLIRFAIENQHIRVLGNGPRDSTEGR